MKRILTTLLVLFILTCFTPWADVAHAVDQRNVTLIRNTFRLVPNAWTQWNYGNLSIQLSEAFTLTTSFEDIGGTYGISLSAGWIEDNIDVSVSVGESFAGDGLIWDGVNDEFDVNVTGPVEIDGDAVDIADDGISDEYVDWGFGANQVGADDIPVDITNFDGNLTGADSDVQTALESIDEFILFGGALHYYLETTASDIDGYKLMVPTYAADDLRNTAVTVLNDDFPIEEWTTAVGQPNATVLLSGVYVLHFHAFKDAGQKDATVYFELYKRAVFEDAETLLGTSEESSTLPGASTSFDIHLYLTDQAILSTDRLVIKVLANESGAGTDAEIEVHYQGTGAEETLTRFSFPSAAVSGQTSLDDAYDYGDTIDYTTDTGPVVLNFPDGGAVDTIATAVPATTWNIRNMWEQANEGDASNVTHLFYTESPDSNDDYHLMGVLSTDSGTNKYLRWFITSLGHFQGVGFSVYNYPTNTNPIHQITQNGVIFNEQGSDIDFRIESDNHTNAFFIDASADTISIVATELYIGDVDTATTLLLADGSGNYLGLIANAMADDYQIKFPNVIATESQMLSAIGVAGTVTTLGWIAEVTDTDKFVQIDVDAAAGYLGAASNDGVFRVTTTNGLTYADGGDFITIAFDADYGDISGNDGATGITGAELETLSDGSDVGALHTHTGLNINNKAITIELPADDEDITLWFTDYALTIVQLAGVIRGALTPGVIYTIRHHTDRSDPGNEIIIGGSSITSLTTGDIEEAFDDATIPENSWIWIETNTISSVPSEMAVTLSYTID